MHRLKENGCNLHAVLRKEVEKKMYSEINILASMYNN